MKLTIMKDNLEQQNMVKSDFTVNSPVQKKIYMK